MSDYRKIIDDLQNAGFMALIVGGQVRDMCTNKISLDVDIATNADTEHIQAIFPHATIGKGTNFLVNIVDGYEVATFRKDIYKPLSGLQGVEAVDSFEEDSSRRDLTINSLGYDPNSGAVLDYHGGRQDIDDRLIRFVGTPEDRICEDPVRMLRACRFASSMEFRMVPSTFRAIKAYSNMITGVPQERIMFEIMKAMKSNKPSIFFEYMHRTGLLAHTIPEMEDCWWHDGGRHHSEYVHEHLLICGDKMNTDNNLLRLVGYLHDIGKVVSYDEKTFKFIGHEHSGAKLIDNIMRRLKFSTAEIKYATTMVEEHMSHVEVDTKMKTVRKLIGRLDAGGSNWKDWVLLNTADRWANQRRDPFTLEEIATKEEMFEKAFDKEQPDFAVKDLEINGYDVMALGIEGVGIGKILDYYFELVLDDLKLNARDYLLHLLNEVDDWSEYIT